MAILKKTQTIRAVEVKAYAVVCKDGKPHTMFRDDDRRALARVYKAHRPAADDCEYFDEDEFPGENFGGKPAPCSPHTVIPLSGIWPRKARAKARRR
jgi:hypothetical protein